MEQGKRSHAFSQVRDPTWLKQYLRVTAERTTTGVNITLALPHPAHKFPTGDLFRRLEVGCETRDGEGKAIARDVQYLARHFGTRYGSWEMQLLSDDRVFDEPSVVELTLPPQEGRTATTAAWWVTLQRVLMPSSRANGPGGKIESEVKLETGAIPWQAK
jgi:hypothetical protein